MLVVELVMRGVGCRRRSDVRHAAKFGDAKLQRAVTRFTSRPCIERAYHYQPSSSLPETSATWQTLIRDAIMEVVEVFGRTEEVEGLTAATRGSEVEVRHC